MNLFRTILADYHHMTRLVSGGRIARLSAVVIDPGFWAVTFYRLASRFYRMPFGPASKLLAKVIALFPRVVFAIEIHPGAAIGPGFTVLHGAGVVIGGGSVIGEGCSINQGVTVGGNFDRVREEDGRTIRQPVLGDGVHVAAGAKVLGPVVVGHGALIGANAVVVRDVPPYAVVVGIPARVLRIRSPES